MTDPFVGQLTFIPRPFGRALNWATPVYNPVKKERVGPHLLMHANNREEIKEAGGDIAACVGLKECTTGETLCDPGCADHPRAHGVPGAGDPRRR